MFSLTAMTLLVVSVAVLRCDQGVRKSRVVIYFFVCDGIKNFAQTIIQPPMVSASSALSLLLDWITFERLEIST